MKNKIFIFDTTLRDGEQSPGATMNPEEKLKVAQQLARLNVDVIEAGFPISSQGDFEAVELIAKKVEGPTIAGLARVSKEDIEKAYYTIKHAEKHRIHTFIATSEVHMSAKLKMSPDEVIKAAVEGVKYARELVEEVEFSAEDATRSNLDFLCEIIEKTIDAGAGIINIPDTVGYTVPSEFGELIKNIFQKVSNLNNVIFSVHCHNDLGLATANSIVAIRQGVRQIECTINGIGERAGNASLEEIVMLIKTRKDIFDYYTDVQTQEIYKASRLISSITGIEVQPNKAVVGRNAFAHEAGIHQAGILRDKRTYEIMDASSIGLTQSTLVLGKHSGRHAFLEKLKELGYELNKADLNKAFIRFKELADKKKDISDWDIQSIIEDEILTIPETFHLESVNVMCGGLAKATAMIGMAVNEQIIEESAIGVGPVDAVYQCIKKITQIKNTLVDFSVKSVTGGLDALGEVTVKLADENGKIFIGKGASLDIIESSAKAYTNAINKLVYYKKTH